MLSSNTLPLFLLPAFVLPALAVPVQLRAGKSADSVWITKENTLNATTWNGVAHSNFTSFTPATNLTSPATNLTSSTSPKLGGDNTSNTTSPGSLTGEGLTIASSLTITRASGTRSHVYAPTIINAPNGAGAPAGSSSDVVTSSSSTPASSSTSTTPTTIRTSTRSSSTTTRSSTSSTRSSTSTTRSSTSSSGSSSAPSSVQPSVPASAPSPFSTSIDIPDMENKNITINVNIDARQASDEPSLLTSSSSSEEGVNFAISRENTITDIAGARARANPARYGLDAGRVHAGTVATGVDGTVSRGVFTLQLVNKLASNNVRAYISGLDPNGALVMLGQNGKWIYPTTSSGTPVPVEGEIAIPLGPANSTTPVALPGFITSSRVWIADGELSFLVVATPNGPGLVEPAAVNPNDPNSEVNYAFAEFSWAADYGIYVNVSYVDFVGLPLGMTLETYASVDNMQVLGVPADAAYVLCAELRAQAQKDGQPWDQLCAYDSTGKVRRVLAPPNLIADDESAFAGYFDDYVNRVWEYYSANDLTIDTQSTPGNVTCRVQGDQLVCAGDNRSYSKPSAKDIFGCNDGPFAIQAGDNAVHLATVPRLCAAFNRATFLIEGGNVQPSLGPECYYPASEPVNNWYAGLLKKIQWNGMGYAFSYDDVEPAGGAQAGLLSSTSPKVLTIIVGGN